MILNETMTRVLYGIRRAEPRYAAKVLDLPVSELGNGLISLYYSSERLDTRELITKFMHEAGVVWLRKLLTKDMAPIASTETHFASLNDYVGLLAANDDILGFRPKGLGGGPYSSEQNLKLGGS